MITGKKINEGLNFKVRHSLYRKDGLWYHHLKHFPGILFDYNGYVRFDSKEEYESTPSLQHVKDLHVVNGIASLKSYVLFNQEQKNVIVNL
ncbi:hypothetical protein HDF19_11940 [Mucilaginibacter sp. E4BP6]|uniref:hypothetical protein n=1 Tax=Mucilaginibacter sp. E4BP6 TaxID=2723089 RepID=UPI0015C835D0|nr:hypothetical protein [Mucilaginibacter sp. E4BP6]NYE65126.1 hypothetical protein [Mucilaginibacter sp. E4BP6]